MNINSLNVSTIRPLKPGPASADQQLADAKEVQKAFRSFVGETFFGQMLKSMRSTQGKPAYFDGGQAEQVFRSQLDQTLAQNMAETSADKIADPMFRQQFPREAELIRREEASRVPNLHDLQQLARR